MPYIQRSILLLICLTVLFCASCAFAQEKQQAKVFPCKNQAEVKHIGFEKVIGAVELMDIETETLVSEGHTIFTNKGKPIIFATYKFDRQGRLSEKNFYNINGKASPKNTFDYDSENKVIKENYFSAAPLKPYLESKFAYNNDGTLKEIVGSNIEKNYSLGKEVFTYDSTRNYFEVTEYNSYGPEMRFGYTQDAKCRFSEIFGFAGDGKNAGKSVISFDDKDNPILIVGYSNDGSILGKRKLEYEFDKQGNWIKQSHYSWEEENGKFDWKLMRIEYRKINYYDSK
ncbi:MAG TPA: hypothetical protein VF692_00240 [Pyrinomonadaceae bacterium]|jgi:hypothetical protein